MIKKRITILFLGILCINHTLFSEDKVISQEEIKFRIAELKRTEETLEKLKNHLEINEEKFEKKYSEMLNQFSEKTLKNYEEKKKFLDLEKMGYEKTLKEIDELQIILKEKIEMGGKKELNEQ